MAVSNGHPMHSPNPDTDEGGRVSSSRPDSRHVRIFFLFLSQYSRGKNVFRCPVLEGISKYRIHPSLGMQPTRCQCCCYQSWTLRELSCGNPDRFGFLILSRDRLCQKESNFGPGWGVPLFLSLGKWGSRGEGGQKGGGTGALDSKDTQKSFGALPQ